METPEQIKEFIKAEAKSLGFVAVGVCRSQPVPQEVCEDYRKQLQCSGGVGDMTYLLRNEDVRFDPTRLLEGARSLIVLAFNYFPPIRQRSDIPQIAYFAYGQDYHRIIKDKLFLLLEKLKTVSKTPFRARPFVDSAPILERYWALRAGIGRQGKNGLIIVPGYGSYCFLSEIITTLELPPDTPLAGTICGRCTRCIEACPGKAIHADGSFYPTKCTSYQTIEKKGTTPEEGQKSQRYLFGCDICQQVCPHNQKNTPHNEDAFLLPDRLRDMTLKSWKALTQEEFEEFFKGSPLQRAGYEGILRNLETQKEDPMS